MSALTAVVYLGTRPPLGGGLQPAVVAHLYEGGLPRFVAYEVTERDGQPPRLDAIDGAYAPAFEPGASESDLPPSGAGAADQEGAGSEPYPVTDLLLGTYREASAITQRLDVLSEKARANYGRDFRAMVFTSDVEWGSDGYGRLFEARSQLEAHPLERPVVVGFHPGVSDAVRDALAANLDRLDGPVEWFEGGEHERKG